MSDRNEIELTSSLQYSFFSPKIGLNQGSHLEPWLWGKILNKVEFNVLLLHGGTSEIFVSVHH